jgi:hypothetical protein
MDDENYQANITGMIPSIPPSQTYRDALAVKIEDA